MTGLARAQQPFRFYTRLHLSQLTGLKAANIEQLLSLTKEAPEACIYHHTHRFLQQHQYLSPEPPNDFAYWITAILGEKRLGERLVSLDIIQFSDIQSLRQKLVLTIEDYLKANPMAKQRFASCGEEFHFIKSVSFILPTNYEAYDLKEFADILKKVTVDSIYFHIFEARLRLEKKTNDFSYWFETSLGNKALAAKIARLDPYTYTLEDLRQSVIKIIEKDGLS